MKNKETKIEVGKIADLIREAIETAIQKKAMGNEVVLACSSGIRCEMSSTNTSITELTNKAHESFNKLKAMNRIKLVPGYIN